jgi:serine/threonine-protein kinase RsbW
MPTLFFPSRYDRLVEISNFVVTSARSAGLKDSEVYRVQLAVDEACSNIIEHAYGGENYGKIKVTCEVDEGELRVILQDRGKQFDPEKTPGLNNDTPLSKVKSRGAGLGITPFNRGHGIKL